MSILQTRLSCEDWSRRLITPLYMEKYIQTLWNTPDLEKKKNGWILKGGVWSPWFFNMRPVGSSPDLFFEICLAMSDLIVQHEVDLLVGVEMAGIPQVGGVLMALKVKHGRSQRIGFTRPLPKKVRKPIEAMELLRSIDAEVADYGQKEYFEGRLDRGDIVGVFDDMAMDLGSKLIARLIVLWSARMRGVYVVCNKVFYFLNRTPGNREKGVQFINEKEAGLYPAVLDVNYVLEFNQRLPELQAVMKPQEYEAISAFQSNPGQFQDKAVQLELLKDAA